MIDKDIERVKELQSTIYEGGDYIYLNKNDKQALGNVLKELETRTVQVSGQVQELETYKKIAEFLAEKVVELGNELEIEEEGYCNFEVSKCFSQKEKSCKECVLDWARKEVEKDVVKEYIYLVSYHHATGCGTITINMNGKINSTEHILEIHKYIEDKNNLKNVGIISYQLVCEKWVRKEVEKDEP